MLLPLGEPSGPPRTVTAPDGRRFAVFPDGDGFRVTDADCPHNAGPLAEGRLDDGVLTCPWHWYRFDVTTGRCLTTRRHELGIYPAVRTDGRWVADVGAAPAPRSWAERLRAHARRET